MVGYPDLLPTSAACKDTLALTQGDLAFLNQEEQQLNTMLRQDAAAAGAVYVDTYTPTSASIIEPGGARTGFRSGSSQLGTPLDAYDGTPASMTRGIKTSTHPSPGDPAKIASVIIDSAGRNPAPARITLGSDAYSYVRTALAGRLADLEAQRDLAFSTDFPAGASPAVAGRGVADPSSRASPSGPAREDGPAIAS